MTTTTLDASGGNRLVAALAAEWTKVWSLRSTWAALAIAVALGVFYPIITGVAARTEPEAALAIAPVEAAGTGILIMGQIALLTLAALTIAGEYATGSIRSTLPCVPDRQRLLLAKSLVLLPVTVGAGAVLVGTGTLVSLLVTGEAAPVADVLQVAAGAAAYLWLASTIVVALGAAMRSVAGTVTTAVLLMLVLPMTLDQSGVGLLSTIAAGLPGSGGRVLLTTAETAPYGAGGALTVLAAWAVGSQLAAGLLMRRRDG